MRIPRVFRAIAASGIPAVLLILAGGGCATSPLTEARKAYYDGRPEDAIEALNEAKIPDRDRILMLMERGTLHQAADQYKESTADFNEAKALLDDAETHSVSRATTSMLVNDNVLIFRGYPYERTYLHVMAGLSYLAEGDFSGASVEARRIINTLSTEQRGEYPEDAFSHYIAGLCLELVDDSNARIEYKRAAKVSPYTGISDTGQLYPPDQKKAPPDPPPGQTELVCFLLLGHAGHLDASTTGGGSPPRAELSFNGKPLGRAVPLTDIRSLAATSEVKLAAKKAAKTAIRIVAKDAIANEVSKQDETIGAIVWILLMAMEQPDFRHWETLPRFLEVARVPCPSDLDYVDLTVHMSGQTKQYRILSPIHKKGNTFVTFKRIL